MTADEYIDAEFKKGTGPSEGTLMHAWLRDAFEAGAKSESADHEKAMAEAREINTNVRLFDLVHYMRSELHQADLITDEEYSWLCGEAPMANSPKGGSPSPRRLEDYDGLRAELATLRSDAGRAWQPIETAPRDGREVLGWIPWIRPSPSGRNGCLEIVRWDRNLESWMQNTRGIEPTHWQPLPQPPEASLGGRSGG